MTPAASYPHEMPSSGASAARAADLRACLPQLETLRCILRAPVIEDFEAFRQIMMSERAQYMDGPFDRSGAWDEFTECVSGWLLRGYGAWAIEEKTNGAVIGFTLVHMEFGDREPELGWFLTAEAEGKGYAFEAAKAAKAYALETLELPSLVSYIDPPNTRSIRLAEKLGAWHDAAASAEFEEPICVYRHAPLGGTA